MNDDIEALEADTFEEAQAAAVEAQAIVEEGFAEAAPLIDEALGAAQQSLDPLGITCEDDGEGDGAE